MNTNNEVIRDERTVAEENAAYRWACNFLFFALLLDGTYRTWFRHESAWDMMAMIILGGGTVTIYRIRRKVMPKGWVKAAIILAVIAGVLGALTARAMVHFRK
jgi:hypothetical protein